MAQTSSEASLQWAMNLNFLSTSLSTPMAPYLPARYPTPESESQSFESIGRFVQESLVFERPVKGKLSICPICFNRSTSSRIDRAFNAVVEYSR
jgi:hypothetical protein